VTVGTNQIERRTILNASRDHFEGIEANRILPISSHIFENIGISWMVVSQTAEVAGFWGMGKIPSGFCCHASEPSWFSACKCFAGAGSLYKAQAGFRNMSDDGPGEEIQAETIC
jgi:hypothetical protein